MIVEGEVLGSAAQGIGNALCEELQYDAEGQWLTGSLMDSLVPTALEMPALRIAHTEPLLLAPLAACRAWEPPAPSGRTLP